jgi:hypothetical protein
MSSREFAQWRADYELEPWDGPGRGERADHRAFVQMLAAAPLGRDVSSLVHRINPWDTAGDDAEPVAPQTVASKVRMFNAGLSGIAAAIKARKKR